MGICGLSEEEKKAIEYLKAKMTNWRKYMPEDKELHAEDIVLNLIQKQDTEINKLKRALDEMAGTFLKTYRDWEVTRYIFDNHICKKIKNPQREEDDCYTDIYDDKACKDCIKEYFIKEDK